MKRRRVFRTAFLLITVCIGLWRLPSVLDTFAQRMGENGSPMQSVLAAAGAAAGVDVAGLAKDQKGKPSDSTIIVGGGKELTEAERERLMRQARAMAPLPLDGSDDPKRKKSDDGDQPDPLKAIDDLQKQLDDATRHVGGR